MRYAKTLLACTFSAALFTQPALANDQLVYVGTYTNTKNAKVESKGIYAYQFNSENGKLSPLGLAAEVTNPSFVAVSNDKKHLYSVSEVGGSGAVTSFNIDLQTGKLTALNSQSTETAGPCYVSVHPSGSVVLAANYGGGSVISYPVQKDGSLGAYGSSILHTGPSEVNERRQKKPHAHSIVLDIDGKRAFSADLGCDKVFIYDVDATTGKLTSSKTSSVSTPPGSGPRHVAFHPNGKFFYVNGEMTMDVSAFSYDPATGASSLIETLSTLPAGKAVEPKHSTAEVLVHPSGKFLYVSNRGDHSLAIYTIDQATGKLSFVETSPTIVETPRNFRIDQTGKWLIAAGQSTHNLAIFSIDQNSGKLKSTGQLYDVGSPVCIKFISLK